MACYVCSSGKPFRTAPIRVNDSFLGVPGHSSISCSVSCQHASQTTLPSNGSHLSCPLDDDLLEDRVNFFFLFISSSTSSGVLETSQGFSKCLLHWINWGCIVRASLSRLVFNGIPTEWGSEHVPGGSVAWFPALSPCACPWGLLGNIVLQEAPIIEAVGTASRTALTWPCWGDGGRRRNKDSVICLAAFIHWFSWTLLHLTLCFPNVAH